MRVVRIIPILALMALLVVPFQMTNAPPQDGLESVSEGKSNQEWVRPDQARNLNKDDVIVTSQDNQVSGVLDPSLVENLGYYPSGVRNTITAPWYNETLQIPIDTDNKWKASLAELDIWDLERLYAVNGSFDEGIVGQNLNPSGSVTNYPYGWDAYSYDSGTGQVQVAEYASNLADFIVLENQGEKKGPSGVQYDHYGGTWVSWNQTVHNAPHIEDFTLDFKFLYDRGPLVKTGGDPFSGNCSILVQANGTTVWKRSLPYLESRGIWYETGDIPINLTQTGNYTLSVVLSIDETMDLNAEDDLDNDGFNDGHVNVVYVTFYVDDIHLVGSTPPSSGSVDLQFEANDSSNPITGTGGSGNATVLANDYWTESPVSFTLSSNVSTSYNYEVRLRTHKFTNSSWKQDIAAHGVAYEVQQGQSAELNFYTYVSSEDDYEDLVIRFYYPDDWVNGTVYDPFLENVTSQCEISDGFIEIPTNLLSRNGWWQSIIYSPNYLKTSQIEEFLTGTWSANDVFQPDAEARVSLSLGTMSETPTINDPINVTWVLPNGTVWSSETIIETINGAANSSSRVLAGTNTSAGQWSIEVLWVNRTEVAYGSMSFDMYHYSILTPVYSHIDADVGDLISNFVYMNDADTGEFLLDDSVTILANWSETTIVFTENLVKNWWEGDFDTDLVGGGLHYVRVNASRPYYTESTTSFTIKANYTTSLVLDGVSGDIESISLSDTLTVYLRYERTEGSGIAGATVNTDYSGPANGLTVNSYPGIEDGNYTVELTAETAGTYSVTITTSKDYHYPASETFTLIVGEKAADLQQLNGTNDLIRFGEDYRYVFLYTNGTGYGLEEANITLQSSSPESGIVVNDYIEHGSGYYSVLIEPSVADTFSLIFKANLTDYETEYATFTLTVSEIPTVLTTSEGSDSITLDQTKTIQLYLEDDSSNPLNAATIEVIDPNEDLVFSLVDDLGTGGYNITVTPLNIGTYSIAFLASLDNYQNSTTSFILVVNVKSALLVELNGTTGQTVYGDPFRYVVRYTDNSSNGLVGANISVSSAAPESGVDWSTSDDLDGYYSISFTPLYTDVFTIIIKVNLTDYETEYASFTLVVSGIPTILTVSKASESITLDSSTTIQLYLEDDNLNPLSGATIEVLDPDVNLDFSTFNDLGTGEYNVTVSPYQIGTYSIAFTATLSNYLNSTAGYVLVVTEKSAILHKLNGTTGQTEYGNSYYYVLRYTDGSDNGLAGANASVLNVDPESSIFWSSSDDLDGYYTVIIDPVITGTLTIIIRVNLTDFETEYATLTLVVKEVPTILTIFGGSDSIALDDNTTIQLYLEDDELNPLPGATIEVLNPDEDLDFSLVDDLGTGTYNITVSPLHTGTYSIAFLANLDNYVNSTTGFVLLVTENSAIMVKLNGTNGQIEFGESYRYVLQYTDGSNDGLVGANVSLSSVTPESGVEWTWSDDLSGFYSLILTPLFTDTFTIVIRVNLTDYETELATFTLVVSEVPTILTIKGESSKTIAIDQTHTIHFVFEDEDKNKLSGATILVLDPPDSLVFSSVTDMGDGSYNITITVSETGTFVIAFRATLSNYRNASVGFNLIVTEVPTSLEFVDGNSEVEVDYMENYVLLVGFERTDLGKNVSLATIEVLGDNLEGLNIDVSENTGLYYIELRASLPGTYTLTITASKEGFLAQSKNFIFDVQVIDTDAIPDISLGQIVYGREVSFLFEFRMSSNETFIDYANDTFLGDSAEWFTSQVLDNSSYLVTLVPVRLGRYQTTINLELVGFESQSFVVEYTVIEVPVEVIVLTPLNWMEGQISQFTIQLVESDTGTPVGSTIVRYGISTNGIEPSTTFEMTEESDGVYSATMTMPISNEGETYTLRIYIEKAFHSFELDDGYFEQNLLPQYNEAARLSVTIANWSPIIILMVGFPTSMFITYRFYDRRRKAEIIRDQAVKRRFDDLHNLIGILILHRSSGLPVYSRFLREGFDESMISAFITAVTQFRMEVERDGEIPDGTLLPISDIIRVFYTESLVCAFITVGSPSMFHREKMVEFGDEVGEQFDEQFRITPTELLDDDTYDQLDVLFDDVLDGSLLKKYKLVREEDLPRGLKCLELGARALDSEAMDLPELAHKMTMCGFEEGRAYRAILDAISQDIIEPVKEDENSSDTGLG